jgi:hypothetical protein
MPVNNRYQAYELNVNDSAFYLGDSYVEFRGRYRSRVFVCALSTRGKWF